MYLYDFSYDGKNLSEFGFMVCEFNSSSQVKAKGSEVTFTLAPVQNGKRKLRVGSRFEKTLSATFQICKDPDKFDERHMTITPHEFRALSRWLNRRGYHLFRSYDWCEPEIVKPWFYATFTLSKVEIGGTAYAIELEMQTDSPFGYGEIVTEEISFTSDHLSQVISDKNDEIGSFYPDMEVTCKAAGTLTITNDITGCTFQMKSCANGETITQFGEELIVLTSRTAHKIANDFNYDWFSMANTYDERENTITVSIPCDVKISYRPVWKDTI